MNSDLHNFEEELNILDELEPLFEDLSIDEPTPDQLYKMYGVFLDNIVEKPIIIKGSPLLYNRNKSKHPLCKGKFKAFEHIITRESKYSGKRDFDHERANRIHWIRPIIENVSDSRIKYFERINKDGFNQKFYWYEEKNFIVIVRVIRPELMLITSFKIDIHEKNKFKDWYNEYNG